MMPGHGLTKRCQIPVHINNSSINTSVVCLSSPAIHYKDIQNDLLKQILLLQKYYLILKKQLLSKCHTLNTFLIQPVVDLSSKYSRALYLLLINKEAQLLTILCINQIRCLALYFRKISILRDTLIFAKFYSTLFTMAKTKSLSFSLLKSIQFHKICITFDPEPLLLLLKASLSSLKKSLKFLGIAIHQKYGNMPIIWHISIAVICVKIVKNLIIINKAYSSYCKNSDHTAFKKALIIELLDMAVTLTIAAVELSDFYFINYKLALCLLSSTMGLINFTAAQLIRRYGLFESKKIIDEGTPSYPSSPASPASPCSTLPLFSNSSTDSLGRVTPEPEQEGQSPILAGP